MPTFTSFDDAWHWFTEGGALEPVAERRERFTQGRAQFLALQAPLGELPIAGAIAAFQDEISDIDGISPMPPDLLHISIRGVGFQVIERKRADDVLREEVSRIAERAASVMRGVKPIELTAGPVNVFPDAIVLEVHDGGVLNDLRMRLAALVPADVFGYDATQYLPHITIAWFLSADAAPTLRKRLPALRDREPIACTLRRTELARWWFTGVDYTEDPERDVVRSYPLRG